MHATMLGEKSDGNPIEIAAEDTGEVIASIKGKQAGGTLTNMLVSATGEVKTADDTLATSIGSLNTAVGAVTTAVGTVHTAVDELKALIDGILNATEDAAKVELNTQLAGEDITYGVIKVQQNVKALNMSATQTVATGPGRYFGFIINSFTATATVTVYDNTSAAGTKIQNTVTPTAIGAIWVLPVAVEFTTGLHIVIATEACDITVLYRPTGGG